MFNFCGWLHRKFLIKLAGKVLENQLKPGNINNVIVYPDIECISWQNINTISFTYSRPYFCQVKILFPDTVVESGIIRNKILKLNQGFSNHKLPTLSQHLSQVNVAEIYQYRDGSSHPQLQLSVGDGHRISKASILLKLSSSVAM